MTTANRYVESTALLSLRAEIRLPCVKGGFGLAQKSRYARRTICCVMVGAFFSSESPAQRVSDEKGEMTAFGGAFAFLVSGSGAINCHFRRTARSDSSAVD